VPTLASGSACLPADLHPGALARNCERPCYAGRAALTLPAELRSARNEPEGTHTHGRTPTCPRRAACERRGCRGTVSRCV